jgi:ketosteroid isomerase-like protein
MSILAAGQSSTGKHTLRAKRPAGTSAEAPLSDEEADNQLRKRLTDILNAWSLMDADQIAKYYSKSADHVFFELTPPAQQKGFDQYYLGMKKFFDQYNDLNLKLNDDAAVHFKGDLAYATATWDLLGTLKDGTKQHLALRWTVVLERENGDWLVVHEHVSAPLTLAAPEPSKTLPPPQPEKPKDPFK